MNNSKITQKDRYISKKEIYNEQLIDILDKMAEYTRKTADPFKSKAYKRAQESLILFQGNITKDNYKNIGLEKLPGIGETILKKINTFIETGHLSILDKIKNDPRNVLTNVYGIGPKKAEELIKKGITTIEDLKKHSEELNSSQKIGLQYYNDIMERIPRKEIEQFQKVFASSFQKVKDKDSHFEIVGSFRRGAKTSGDIDVIITSPNKELFKKFMDNLLEKNIIIEVLSRGPTKSLVIAKLPNKKIARRVDFLYSDVREYPFALLYFTGSKIFNTVMRGRALKMKYSLNEHGLYHMDGKKKGSMVDKHFQDEEAIFKFLKMEYKSPEDRKDGTAVVPLPGSPAVELFVPDGVEIIKVEKKNRTKKNRKTKIEKEAEKEQKKLAKETEKEQKKLAKEAEKEQKKLAKEAEKKNKTKKTREIKLEKKEINKTLKHRPMEKDILLFIEKFKKGGIPILETLKETTLSHMLKKTNEVYRNLGPNENPLLTDNQYDILEDYIKNKYPKNKELGKIGAPVEKNKVLLPYYMASMDKIKPDTKALPRWMEKYKGPYVLSCKLDGVSGLYYCKDGERKLYTRGDGAIGQDVSHFIPYLNLPSLENAVIRGEFIMKKKTFISKYQDKFANPRNLIAGTINRLSVNEVVKDIDFICYEVIVPSLKPSMQMDFLKQYSLDCVKYEQRSSLNNTMLSELLVKWRKEYEYEIDGVIVTDDKIYARKKGNPDHSFAFKMVLSDQVAETKVVNIEWNPSKDGFLKPRVQVEPIYLGGVKIEYATGFNGLFIEKNKIGIGALIEIIRSGDVIPYITKVIEPSSEGKMPSVPYKWNDTHVDVLLMDMENNKTVLEKNIHSFFRGIKVEGLSEGYIKRLVETGFNSVSKIIHMTKEDFLKIEGFQDKLATKLVNNIQNKIKEASLTTIMAASNMFGRGFSIKKIDLIMDAYPSILTSDESLNNKKDQLLTVKGMAKISAENFVDHIPKFLGFLQETKLQSKLQKVTKSSPKNIHPILSGKSIVMSGTRDKDLEEHLKQSGASLGSSVSGNTFAVICLDKESDSSKVKAAKQLNIPLFTPKEFRNKYYS